MGWINRDYFCKACAHEWVDLVQRSEENDQVCPECGGPASIGVSAPNVASYSLMDKQAQAKVLRKRSREHTLKWLKKDPSHLGHKKPMTLKPKG